MLDATLIPPPPTHKNTLKTQLTTIECYLCASFELYKNYYHHVYICEIRELKYCPWTQHLGFDISSQKCESLAYLAVGKS